jgi:hypothetical protein
MIGGTVASTLPGPAQRGPTLGRILGDSAGSAKQVCPTPGGPIHLKWTYV